MLVVSNVILGILLSQNIVYAIYAVRLSYLPFAAFFILRFNAHSLNLSAYQNFFKRLFNWYFAFAVISLLVYIFFPKIDVSLVKLVGGRVNFYVIRRMSGVFFSPVLWGTFMSTAAIYTFTKLNDKFNYRDLIIFCVFWFSMVLSVSRGAIVSFYIGALIICFITKKYLPFFKTLAACSLIYTVFSLINPLGLSLIGFVSSSSVHTLNDGGEENGKIELFEADSILVKDIKSTRIKYWALSYQDFKNKPMGYGLGKAGHIGNRFYNTPTLRKEAAIYSTDGWYLKIANETGIWGLLSYLAIFVIHLIFFIKNSQLLKHQLFLFSFVLFVMITIQNLMSNVLDFYSFSCFYWLTIALVYNIKYQINNEPQIH